MAWIIRSNVHSRFHSDLVYNLKKEEMIIIGDQIVTDIISGKRFKIKTILVDPLGVKDLKITVIAEDKLSGLADKAYSIDNKNWQSSNEFTVEKDGEYTLTEVNIDTRQWQSCTVSDEMLEIKIPGYLEVGK